MLLKDFYTIQQLVFDGWQLAAKIELNADHDIYKGHFPDVPVVPGVCMITICKELLEESFYRPLMLTASRSVKFLGVVNPNEQNLLQADLHITSNQEGTLQVKCQLKAGEMLCYKADSTYQYV